MKEKQFVCNYCCKKFKNGLSLGGHVVRCVFNPNREKIRLDTSVRMKRRMNNMSGHEKEKLNKKISDTVFSLIKAGKWHTSLKNTRRYDYKGVKLHGSWELEYAKWLDKNGVRWVRPLQSFVYYKNNEKHYYYPDFYLIDSDEYIEIKGYETVEDKLKQLYFPCKLTVLRFDDLKKLGLKIKK